jgi:Zn-dependent protease with chaperone function
MPAQLGYLRRLEKQADMFAVEHIEKPRSFASAMTKLAKQNLIDPSPGKLEELLLYDHPPVSKRLSYTKTEDNQQ